MRRFPLPYHGLSYERTKKYLLLPQKFFARPSPVRKQAFDGRVPYEKSTQRMLSAFRSFVIRTGFEPVTHSLEGCCSIQLSYRTSPYISVSGMT